MCFPSAVNSLNNQIQPIVLNKLYLFVISEGFFFFFFWSAIGVEFDLIESINTENVWL